MAARTGKAATRANGDGDDDQQRTPPASGLPPYVTIRGDKAHLRGQARRHRLAMSYFAAQETLMHCITVGGRPGTGQIGVERGHPVYTIGVELPRGTSRTIVLKPSEPAGTGAPIVLRQPLVRPLNVTLKDAVCGRPQLLSTGTGRRLGARSWTKRTIRPADASTRANTRDRWYC